MESPQNLPSPTVPDPSREVPKGFWDPGRKLIKAIRDYQRESGTFSKISRPWAVLRHRFWSAVTSCDIPLNTKIGVGLLIPHATGIVVHKNAVIGPNCLLMQNVTLGQKGMGDEATPVLGGGVDVSAGAVILGGIEIGASALVAANAVVTKDVPAGSIVGGVPAKLLGSRLDMAPSEE